MGELSKRSTVYFEPEIHHALRVKAANTHQSISEVVNEALRLALRENQEDLSAFEKGSRRCLGVLDVRDLIADLACKKRTGYLSGAIGRERCQPTDSLPAATVGTTTQRTCSYWINT